MNFIGRHPRWLHGLALAAILALGLVMSNVAAAAAPSPAQRTFDTPDAAAAALVDAVKVADRNAMLAILGKSAAPWIFSGDKVADRAAGSRFVEQYGQKHGLSVDGDRATLAVGPDDWPFPFPLVKSDKGWRFDAEAGREEMLARRVGQNELATINVMLAIVDAQRDYASADRDKDGVRTYARRFASTPGKKDGLYWPTAAGDPPSPLGPLVVQASAEGYGKQMKDAKDAKPSQPPAYHGYRYRILSAQGKHAKGGELDYVVRGRMIGGFAVVAWPANYASSGVMTFLVNHDGVVYQKDLGPDTARIANAMKRFDPDDSWKAVESQ